MNRHAKQLQAKSHTHTVEQFSEELYAVTSGVSGTTYFVLLNDAGGATCSCDWATKRHHDHNSSGCSHALALFAWLAQTEHARTVSAWSSLGDAQRQHRPVIDIGDGILLTTRAAEPKPLPAHYGRDFHAAIVTAHDLDTTGQYTRTDEMLHLMDDARRRIRNLLNFS